MFGISGTELIIAGVLAALLIGPEGLPDVAKAVGKTLRQVRPANGSERIVIGAIVFLCLMAAVFILAGPA